MTKHPSIPGHYSSYIETYDLHDILTTFYILHSYRVLVLLKQSVVAFVAFCYGSMQLGVQKHTVARQVK